MPLNTKTSIVDYLKSKGKPSDFASRTQLAQKQGISNYTGSFEQNKKLLNQAYNSGQQAAATDVASSDVTPDTNIKNVNIDKGTLQNQLAGIQKQRDNVLNNTPLATGGQAQTPFVSNYQKQQESALKRQETARAGIARAQTPTQREIQLTGDVTDLESQLRDLNRAETTAVQGLEGQGRGITLGIVRGQQEKLTQQAQRERGLKIDELALKQSQLGYETALRQAELGVAQTQEEQAANDLTRLDTLEQNQFDRELKIENWAKGLRDEQRQIFGTTLKSLEGTRFEDMSPEAQQSLTNMAAQAGIPIDAIKNGLDVQADAADIKNEKDQLDIQATEMGITTEQLRQDQLRKNTELLNIKITDAQKKAAAAAEAKATGKLTLDDLQNTTAEEDRVISNVMRLLPTKLKDNVKEVPQRQLEILADIRRGLGIQEIADKLKGFVLDEKLSPEENNLANTFRSFAIGSDAELGDIAAAINRGNDLKAMTTVENANLDTIDGVLKDAPEARTIIERAQKIQDMLDEVPESDLGQFDGRKFKVKRFFGLSNEEAQKIQSLETQMVLLLNDIRRKSLGTAVTESEVQFLQPMLTSLLDQPEIIDTKLTELRNGTVLEHNNAREQTGLPPVNEAQILDNEARLQMYRDISGGSQQPTQEETQVVNGVTYRKGADGLYYPE